MWLIDPEPLRGLEPIAEMLGLVLNPGTVVDFVLEPRSGAPVFAVGTAGNYGRHPITQALSLNTLFPHARQIATQEREEWRAIPLIEVAPRGWIEVGKIEPEVTFDPARDTPGPITVAQAFERIIGDRQQRVVVVGTGHFLSNTYLGNGGNLELGVSMMNWLAGADHLVTTATALRDAMFDIGQTIVCIALAFARIAARFIGPACHWWRRAGRHESLPSCLNCRSRDHAPCL